MSGMRYFINDSGVITGPFTLNDARLRVGGRDHYDQRLQVRREDESIWRPVARSPDLADLILDPITHSTKPATPRAKRSD